MEKTARVLMLRVSYIFVSAGFCFVFNAFAFSMIITVSFFCVCLSIAIVGTTHLDHCGCCSWWVLVEFEHICGCSFIRAVLLRQGQAFMLFDFDLWFCSLRCWFWVWRMLGRLPPPCVWQRSTRLFPHVLERTGGSSHPRWREYLWVGHNGR